MGSVVAVVTGRWRENGEREERVVHDDDGGGDEAEKESDGYNIGMEK